MYDVTKNDLSIKQWEDYRTDCCKAAQTCDDWKNPRTMDSQNRPHNVNNLYDCAPGAVLIRQTPDAKPANEAEFRTKCCKASTCTDYKEEPAKFVCGTAKPFLKFKSKTPSGALRNAAEFTAECCDVPTCSDCADVNGPVGRILTCSDKRMGIKQDGPVTMAITIAQFQSQCCTVVRTTCTEIATGESWQCPDNTPLLRNNFQPTAAVADKAGFISVCCTAMTCQQYSQAGSAEGFGFNKLALPEGTVPISTTKQVTRHLTLDEFREFCVTCAGHADRNPLYRCDEKGRLESSTAPGNIANPKEFKDKCCTALTGSCCCVGIMETDVADVDTGKNTAEEYSRRLKEVFRKVFPDRKVRYFWHGATQPTLWQYYSCLSCTTNWNVCAYDEKTDCTTSGGLLMNAPQLIRQNEWKWKTAVPSWTIKSSLYPAEFCPAGTYPK